MGRARIPSRSCQRGRCCGSAPPTRGHSGSGRSRASESRRRERCHSGTAPPRHPPGGERRPLLPHRRRRWAAPAVPPRHGAPSRVTFREREEEATELVVLSQARLDQRGVVVNVDVFEDSVLKDERAPRVWRTASDLQRGGDQASARGVRGSAQRSYGPDEEFRRSLWSSSLPLTDKSENFHPRPAAEQVRGSTS